MKRAGVAAALLLACACGDSEPARSQTRVTLDALTEGVMLPMLERFEQKSEALARRNDALCNDPSEQALRDARQAWQTARAAWRQMDVLSFGPQTLPPWRLAPQLDFAPSRVSDIERALHGDRPFAADGGGMRLGASQKGLPAIEYLLYGADGSLKANVFEDGDDAARRCEYLRAISANLIADASELHAAWRQEFVPELYARGKSELYADLAESFGAIVNNLAFSVEVLRDERLGKPLGIKSGGTPDPSLIESRFSGRSLEDARDTLRGVESILYGRIDEQRDGTGLIAHLRRRNEAQARGFEANARARIAAAYQALDAIDPSLAEALLDHPERVEAARAALRELLLLFQVDLTQALSVTVTFGGADGD